jgi:hypothetical protein
MFVVLKLKTHRDLRKTIRVRIEAQKAIKIRELGIQLQHQIAEVVRTSVGLRKDGKRFDCKTDLRRIGELVNKYLRQRLGEDDYAITVKHIKDSRLRTIFRDSGQHEDVRKLGDDIAYKDSYVFSSFQAQTDNPTKFVLVRDVQLLDERDHAFKDRATNCGFRSVVGFPLRSPILPDENGEEGELKCAKLLGFISIDSGRPDAFDALFDQPQATGEAQRNDGGDLSPLPDTELFYGLADSIATIIVLNSIPLSSG